LGQSRGPEKQKTDTVILRRKKMKTKLFIGVLMVLMTSPLFAEPQLAESRISSVIVYHGQALVTRTIQLDHPGGDLELLVENLPERILPETLYAQASDGIQVLSVRYRIKEIEKDNSKEVKELEDQIYTLERQLRDTVRSMDNANDRLDRYREQWKFITDTSKVEMTHGVLNAPTIIDLNVFMASKNSEIHKELVILENQKLDLEKQLAAVREKKDKLVTEYKRQIRQALVYVHVPAVGAADIVQLSYLVDSADWSPQYNLKANPAHQNVHIDYNAVVHQSSGEDWIGTELALSTAAPALVAAPPVLNPMQITLTGAGADKRGLPAPSAVPQPAVSQRVEPLLGEPFQQPTQQQESAYSYGDQTERFAQLAQSRRASIARGIKASAELNQIAIYNQMIEFEADKRLLQQIKERTVALQRAEGVSVIYKLPGKLTLPSKSDQQLVTIAAIDCPAVFTFAAAPLLTDYVYLIADITNTSNTILLPGAGDIFRDGEFVGKADIKLVTIGQTFTAGFGVDSQIQVAREFKDKKIETLWGNRVDQQEYRIEISNYKNEPAACRLLDRLPWTENPALFIELTAVSHPLSQDADYLRTQKDKGILRWDLTLKPETSGKNATVINYTFTMKYDNDMVIRPMQ